MSSKKEKQEKEISTFKATKRAFTASVVSLVVCLFMLSGTTFAWFADSVTSGKNRIEAGYTDFEVKKYVPDSASEDPYTGEVNAETEVFSKEEWNPGDVRAAYYEITNTGNLDIILNVGLTAKAVDDPTEEVGDLSDYMILNAYISGTDFASQDKELFDESTDITSKLKEDAGSNVGTKNFKTNLFPADNNDPSASVIKPNEKAYVKVLAYLPDFDETTEPKPLIFQNVNNASISGAKCDFSLTVNAFQVIKDVAITYKTFVWPDNGQADSESKLVLQQVPVVNGEEVIKVWKEVNSSEFNTFYAFDQDSLQGAMHLNAANVVVLNDIFANDAWTTIESFSGTIESYYSDRQCVIWGLNNRMINTFNGTIKDIAFKNCKALDPYVMDNNIYNGVFVAKAGENAKICNVDVSCSTIGDRKEGVTAELSYIGALIGWLDKADAIDNDCTTTNNNINCVAGNPEPQTDN